MSDSAAYGRRRIRVTRREPLTGERIGLVVWLGSIDRGWIGKPMNPLRWNETWQIGAPE